MACEKQKIEICALGGLLSSKEMRNFAHRITQKSYTMYLTIRPATADDAADLLAIYRHYIEHTAVTYECDVPTVEAFAQRIEGIVARFPYFVAVIDGTIVGYAYATTFKPRPALDISVETSIYIDLNHHGMGIGRQLYGTLETALAAQGVTNLYASIAYTEQEDEYLTQDSVRFHERVGYRLVGTFRRCAIKFGRHYDLVWMEKILKTS